MAVTGKEAKTHRGLVAAFVEEFGSEPSVRRLLRLRTQADYGRDPLEVSADEMAELLDEGQRLVERCEGSSPNTSNAAPTSPILHRISEAQPSGGRRRLKPVSSW